MYLTSDNNRAILSDGFYTVRSHADGVKTWCSGVFHRDVPENIEPSTDFKETACQCPEWKDERERWFASGHFDRHRDRWLELTRSAPAPASPPTEPPPTG